MMSECPVRQGQLHVVRIGAERIKGHFDRIVRGTVE